MKSSNIKKVGVGVQLSLFVDQNTTIDETGKKIEPTILDKILKEKTKNNANNDCVYKIDNTRCLISEYIWENKPECVLLPNICSCNKSCPYFTKFKRYNKNVRNQKQ